MSGLPDRQVGYWCNDCRLCDSPRPNHRHQWKRLRSSRPSRYREAVRWEMFWNRWHGGVRNQGTCLVILVPKKNKIEMNFQLVCIFFSFSSFFFFFLLDSRRETWSLPSRVTRLSLNKSRLLGIARANIAQATAAKRAVCMLRRSPWL